ncbi:hypothetical protein NOVOSPHI9U_40687 [Novosphingobium sp. 9U]|nr:hypothetical protein NOVOSPHI9U_40687 [Novosphingobium sp. 9U]
MAEFWLRVAVPSVVAVPPFAARASPVPETPTLSGVPVALPLVEADTSPVVGVEAEVLVVGACCAIAVPERPNASAEAERISLFMAMSPIDLLL